jgi:hypothetical protein
MRLVSSILNMQIINLFKKVPEDKMVMNFVSYKSCKLFVCFQILFVCINHFPQFTPILLGLFKSVKEGFYCIHK